MALPDYLPPEVVKVAPGIAGSLVSLLWLRDITWPRKLAMFVAGAMFARFAGQALTDWTHLDAGVGGFLLGLFGMSVVAKLFDTWEKFDLGTILNEWIRKVLGLPAPAPKE